MAKQKYVEPTFRGKLFTCPSCGGLAGQSWSPIYQNPTDEESGPAALVDPEDSWRAESVRSKPQFYWHTSRCHGCDAMSFWAGTKLTYPLAYAASLEEPSESLPDDARTLLAEAIAVFPSSRRASAALCRASLESLLKTLPSDLPMKKPSLEDRINALQRSVDPGLWRLLTAVRHVGNKSLHGAEEGDAAVAMFLDETDDYIPKLLIGVVNQLAGQLIEMPRQTDALYAAIPEDVRVAAERKAGQAAS